MSIVRVIGWAIAAAGLVSAGCWETAKPPFTAYPASMPVQDLRCRIATNSMPFGVARHECEALMNLTKGTGGK